MQLGILTDTGCRLGHRTLTQNKVGKEKREFWEHGKEDRICFLVGPGFNAFA